VETESYELVKLFEKNTEKTCYILKNNEIIFSSEQKGVKPLMDYYMSYGSSPEPLTVVDRIIGKSAAMLAVLIGANHIITPIISQIALDFLSEYNIKVEYSKVVPYIINRTKDGQCPIERSVLKINDIHKGYEKINDTLTGLNKKKISMKKVVIIGGRGKVGGYLIPMLMNEGFNVTSVSRGKTDLLVKNDIWNQVNQVNLDRSKEGFEKEIKDLKADIVIDMICFKNDDMKRLINELRNDVGHYLVCGSMWIHGHANMVPYSEEECREPLEEYGIEKSLMDYTITDEYNKSKFPGTSVHPGHIVCPGDVPINPQGCKSLEAFKMLKDGKTLHLPNFGMESLHHVHAKDVAGVFMAAIKAGEVSFGQGFHAISPRAVTLRGYAIEVARWYGKRANLKFEDFKIWKERMGEELSDQTFTHIIHSPSGSMKKTKSLLGFEPEYTTYQAVRECIKFFGL
jgi:nucleoside-diphosphate-sugar epimerase